jgi:predicted Zn-dependent peptidase
MSFKCTTLPNGMHVATYTMPHAKTVATALTVGVGRRYEKKHEKGISHMLEHMLFKGTKTRSAFDIVRGFDDIGADYNAYTMVDQTVYTATALSEYTETMVDLISDMVQNSTFEEKDLEKEKEAVIEEMIGEKDEPETILSNHMGAKAFPKQPVGASILGSEKSVRSFKPDDFRRFMDKHYRTDNMVFSAAGNIKHEDFVAMVQKYFTKDVKPDTELPKAPHAKFDPAQYHGGGRRVKRELEQTHLMIGLPTVSLKSPDYPALRVYAKVLGGGMSSRLFQEVRVKRGLAYEVSASVTTYDEMSMIEIYSAASPEKTEDLSRVLCEQIASMADGISDAELERAKRLLRTEITMDSVNPEITSHDIGSQLLYTGDYQTPEQEIEDINKVTKEDVQRLAESILKRRPTITSLGEDNKVLPYRELKQLLQKKKHPRVNDTGEDKAQGLG